MEREEVGGRVDLGDGLDALGAELAEAVGRDERVERDDAHAEAERAARDLLADPAEAEHAERLAAELDAAVRAPLPAALLERGVRLRDVARERDEEADRVLGGGDDRRLRRVRDDDPASGRGLDVDVVDADARAADHLEALGALDQLGGELRRRANDDRVVAADDLLERAVGVDVDVEARAQELDAGRGDLLADEDFHGDVERLERGGDRDAALDVRAEIGEDDLDRGELGRDVEDVEPADVAEPEDLPLQLRPARSRS